MKSIFTALLITAAMPAAASAAKFTTVADACGDGCTIIAIIGDIKFYDNITFDYLIRKQKIDKAIVHLDSPGGSVSALLDIGAEIRKAGFWTYVPPGARCTSACADIWLAGKKRFLASDALLGFHSSGQTRGGVTTPSARGDAIVQDYYRMLGLRDDAIDYFSAASPYDMSYVTMPKLKQLGIDCDLVPPKMIVEAPKPVSPKSPVRSAAAKLVVEAPKTPVLCQPIANDGETIVLKSFKEPILNSRYLGASTAPFMNAECTELKAAPNLTVEQSSKQNKLKHERGE